MPGDLDPIHVIGWALVGVGALIFAAGLVIGRLTAPRR